MPNIALVGVLKDNVRQAFRKFGEAGPQDRFKTYLLFFIAAVTLIFDPSLATPFDVIKSILFWSGSLGLLLYWAYQVRVSSSYLSVKFHPLHAAFWGMLLLFLPSLSNSLDLYASVFGVYPYFFQGLLSWIGYGLVFWLVTQAADEQFERKVADASVFLSAVMCGYGFIQIMGWDPTPWQSKPFGPFSTLGNPLFFGGYLALQMPLTAVFIMTRQRRLSEVAGYFLWAVMVSFLLRTLARSGWLAAMGSMGFFALYLGKDEFLRYRKKFVMLVMVSAAVLFWHLFLGPLITREPSHIQNRASVLFSSEESSSKARLEMWKVGLMMFVDHPWFGVGMDNIEHNFWRYRTPEHVKAAPMQATTGPIHNDLLQALVTTGIVGFLGYAAFVMAGAWFLWRLRQQLKAPDRLLAGAWGAILVALGIFGEFNFSVLVTSLWAGVALGFLVYREKALKSASIPWKWVKPAAAVLSLVFVVLVFKCVKIYAADRAFATGNVLSHQKNFEGSRKALAQAVQLNPNVRQYYYSYGLIFLVKSNSVKTPKDQKSYFLTQSASIFRQMSKRFPWHALSWHNLATVLMQLAADGGTSVSQEARDALVKASWYFPELPANYDRYGEILYRNGQKLIGRRLWERALEIDANYIPSRNWMEQFKSEEYIYFFNQDLNISSAPLGGPISHCQLKLVNSTDRDAQVALELVRQPQTLFGDLGGRRDLVELGWVRLDKEKFILPANSIETVNVDIKIPRWPWWRGKKFVAMVHARDLNIKYPFGNYGRIMIETKQ